MMTRPSPRVTDPSIQRESEALLRGFTAGEQMAAS